ncbi:hypothetical protein IT400_03380 [Candidatus Nomurabacteria bacterium]|nr:hypothetical protein [Candidatus Nomurabacteria bacterium]
MDKNNAKEKFQKVQSLFLRMSHEEMCVVVESYYIWRTLTFSRSIPEVGEDIANKNAKLMSLYKEFFLPTEQSHLQTFILGLMKFFDKDPRALSINALIKEIQDNKELFTPDILRSVYPHLQEIGAETENYLPIDQSSIDHFNQLCEKHKTLIANLKDTRDKQLAHTDMEVIKVTFVPNEVEELIDGIQEMFNKLSKSFDRSSTMWDHLKKDSIRSTEFLFQNLERGEKVRLEEIKRKWENGE